ncbi:hypothetical protein B0H66DRAFT_33573 [Apodospora peruviana]|uniref:Secreted protein n=1 Tax=Apodospora peruviana TaxID=516989 RepID=A0AAE0MFD0_9PEZI|nr:hypothetical protein B0H66DRAFT_33573 [Apodospora peruviana]
MVRYGIVWCVSVCVWFVICNPKMVGGSHRFVVLNNKNQKGYNGLPHAVAYLRWRSQMHDGPDGGWLGARLSFLFLIPGRRLLGVVVHV